MIYKVKLGNPEKGGIILVHGLGEHSGRYGKLIKMVNDAGFAVYAFNWHGHGKSGGKRGTCNHRVGYENNRRHH